MKKKKEGLKLIKDSHSFSKVTNHAQLMSRVKKERVNESFIALPTITSSSSFLFGSTMAARRLCLSFHDAWIMFKLTLKNLTVLTFFPTFRRKCRENNIYNPIIQQRTLYKIYINSRPISPCCGSMICFYMHHKSFSVERKMWLLIY